MPRLDSDIEFVKAFNLFDMFYYEDVIHEKFIYRGELYYLQDKIKLVSKRGNSYKFKVSGTDIYDVSVSFNGDDIKSAKCSCPFYKKYNKYCKHIAGSIYSVKCSNNHEVVQERLKFEVVRASRVYEEAKPLRNRIVRLSNYKDIYDSFLSIYEQSKKAIGSKFPDDTVISYIVELRRFSRNVHYICSEVKDNEKINKEKNKKRTVSVFKTSFSIIKVMFKILMFIFDVLAYIGMIFLAFICACIGMDDTSFSKPKKKQKKSQLYYELEPWQQKLVDEGKVDESGFEEEEPEDDDWYSDDPW